MIRISRLTVLVVAVWACFPAFGVNIAGGTGTGNTTGIDNATGLAVPGWDYVGTPKRANGTDIVGAMVYLGEGWVLTANHVGTPATVVFGGVPYTVDSTTRQQLNNPDIFVPGIPNFGQTKTDLALMKLTGTSANWPALETLNIASSRTQIGTEVVMIGNGQNRATTLTKYDGAWRTLPASSTEYVYSGFTLGSGYSHRWGTNVVNGSPYVTQIGDGGPWVLGFTTMFEEGVSVNEAQAAPGDSGGGVFALDGTLVGIMIAVMPLEGQPNSYSAIYGSQTYIADVSWYLPQIFAIAPELRPVPEPATLATLLATSIFVVLRKRRR